MPFDDGDAYAFSAGDLAVSEFAYPSSPLPRHRCPLSHTSAMRMDGGGAGRADHGAGIELFGGFDDVDAGEGAHEFGAEFFPDGGGR